MLAGNEGRLVRRVTSFYDGDRFERDLVSISGVTTYVERIPATDQRTMRALSLIHILRFCCDIKGVARKYLTKHLNDICELTGLGDVRKRLIKNLSKGYKQRVGLAQALVGNPEVVILDEPTVGLEPKQIIEIRKLIRELGADHTVVLSSHCLLYTSRAARRLRPGWADASRWAVWARSDMRAASA